MIQERIKKDYPSAKIPQQFVEQDRGFVKCCDKFTVLAGNGAESWKNDVNSAWLKLSQPSDTVSFTVEKKVGSAWVQTVFYNPPVFQCVNEPFAFYTTVFWAEVQNLEGNGCYRIKRTWNIGGFIGFDIWRNTMYTLKDYTIKNALKTARIRVKFNLVQEIEGIDFTDSNVEDSIRFNGQIRKDQPNTRFVTVTQQNRRIEPVMSEKSQTYMIETDGYTDPVLALMENLYLLSPNEMWISDHNAHTNSYEILDKEVSLIEGESPEREPDDKFARQEVLTCKVGDRYKNEITYY